MWNEDELSDDDLRSVYGVEVLQIRITADILRREQALAETERNIEVLYQRLLQGEAPQQK